MPRIVKLFPLVLLTLSMLLGACATVPTPAPVNLPCLPPADLMTSSAGPHQIPRKALTEKEALQHWGQDRRSLKIISRDKNSLSKFVQEQCR